MSHPYELLAGYVDGELDPGDLTTVEDHLAGCDACRADLEDARAGRDALAGLPELEEPPGIAFAAIKASRRASARATWLPRVAGIAAGLVLVGGGFLLLRSGDGPGGGEAAQSAATGATGQAPALEGAPLPATGGALAYPVLRDTGREVTNEARAAAPGDGAVTPTSISPVPLPALGMELAAEAAEALAQGFPGTARDFYDAFSIESLPPATATALTCVTDSFTPDRSVVPFVIERATADGSPAWVAAFLQGTGPAAPYDRIVIIVTDRDGCTLLTLASQRLRG